LEDCCHNHYSTLMVLRKLNGCV